MWAFEPGDNEVRYTAALEEGLLLHSLRQVDGVKRTANRPSAGPAKGRAKGDGWAGRCVYLEEGFGEPSHLGEADPHDGGLRVGAGPGRTHAAPRQLIDHWACASHLRAPCNAPEAVGHAQAHSDNILQRAAQLHARNVLHQAHLVAVTPTKMFTHEAHEERERERMRRVCACVRARACGVCGVCVACVR